ncbi:MAG TPA: TetR/AcrR family transcriptional regulator [Geobacteraceae bacterium]|nr:TetR/AcrR family transcriptional regulator [Geobacteraceae bacterium]
MGKAETTKQAIIEKAAVIFNKNGYQRTSMSTLTRALGLTKGAIYGNFADKDELAVEAFRYSFQQVHARISGALRPHQGALAKLRVLAGSFLEVYEETVQGGGCPILNTAVDSDDAHPLLFQEVRRALAAWEREIVRLVELGKSTGEIRLDADAGLFAANFIALVEGGILLAKTLCEKRYLEHSVAGINLFIRQMLEVDE